MQMVEGPVVAVDGHPGILRFQVIAGSPGASLDFGRFEIAFVPAPDRDSDGTPDLLDPDLDGDGFFNEDEMADHQCREDDANSRPPDTDRDHLSDFNDPDKDNDGMPDAIDPFPFIPNHRPVIGDVAPQTVRAGETLTFRIEATDADLPVQHLTYVRNEWARPGAAIGADGVFTWTPSRDAALQAYTFTIMVADDGQSPLMNQRDFTVQVIEALAEGFAAVSVATTNGPLSFVMPRRPFTFAPQARTVFLATNGNDTYPGSQELPWRTFAHSQAQLQPGDLLYVRGGDYLEPFTVSRSGQPGSPMVISAYPGECVRILQPEGWLDAHPNEATVTFSWGCSHVWLHGVEVHGGGAPGTPYLSGYNRIAIVLGGYNTNVRLLNNYVAQAYDGGIVVNNAFPGTPSLIEGNVVWECGAPSMGRGLAVNSSSAHGLIVRGNAIINCGDGLDLNYSSGVQVYNNLVANCSSGTFLMPNTCSNMLAHNVWADNLGAGLSFCGSSGTNTIRNCVFLKNIPAHLGFNGYFGATDGAALENSLDFCAFNLESPLASPAEWFTDWIGGHLLQTDLQFIAPDRLDFRLQASSACRNAAAAIPLLGARPYPDVGSFPASYYWLPELASTADLNINEGELFELQLGLAQPNPHSHVRYELLSSLPNGALFNEVTGRLTWQPSESQGPGTYDVAVRTTADDSPLLVSTGSFRINVREINQVPILAPIPEQIIAEEATLSFVVTAADPDIPAQTLAFSLDAGAPMGEPRPNWPVPVGANREPGTEYEPGYNPGWRRRYECFPDVPDCSQRGERSPGAHGSRSFNGQRIEYPHNDQCSDGCG